MNTKQTKKMFLLEELPVMLGKHFSYINKIERFNNSRSTLITAINKLNLVLFARNILE
jgi:hypothetical protein